MSVGASVESTTELVACDNEPPASECDVSAAAVPGEELERPSDGSASTSIRA
jgi:hypothetical protein